MLGLTASRLVASSLVLRRALTKTTWLRPPAVLTYASLLLLCAITATANAQQQTAESGISSSSLPDAPQPQSDQQSAAEQTTSAEGSASVSGVVLDVSGAAVPGAQVSLTHRDGTQLRMLNSGGNGEFAFTKLPAGSYLVIVSAKGFAPFTSAEFVVTAQQSYEVPTISLSVAMTDTEITVRPTDVIAAEQIKAEEKQRFIGVIPNFYISYVHDPAPMTTKQKFSLASHDTFDPVSLIGVGLAAGIEQANNTYAGYGQGAAGYGKRFAAKFGDGRTSDFLSHAVFPSLFHQDPRYFYQGTGSFKSRLVHAASFAIITRSDNGKPMPNYSYFLSDIGSGALSNLYYPHADRGIGLVFTNAAIGIAGKAGGTIVREFFSKRITTNVPGDGKP
nr:carboxypeptidase-like regulatory domain-containing protein [Edaphobacter aggregans]